MIWKAEMITCHNSIYIGGLNIPSAHFVHWTSGCSIAIIKIETEISWHNIHFGRIYSHLEENDEDTIYFYTKSGLSSVIDLSRENVQLSEHNDQKETYRRYFKTYQSITFFLFPLHLILPFIFITLSDFGVMLVRTWLQNWISLGLTNMILTCSVTLLKNISRQ